MLDTLPFTSPASWPLDVPGEPAARTSGELPAYIHAGTQDTAVPRTGGRCEEREQSPDCFSYTSLDHDETSEPVSSQLSETPPELVTTLVSSFRHSGWWRLRRRIYESFKRVGVPHSRMERYATCGSQAWVEARVDWGRIFADRANRPYDKVRVRCNVCKDRFCVPCAGQRARLVATSLVKLLQGEPARFVTLTMVGTDDPLKDQIDRLYVSYKKLRRTTLWIHSVSAAAATLEVTFNAARQQWHPHLHILTKGKFLPHAQLKQKWLEITGDSHIVDIRYIRSETKAAGYIAGYATKPMAHEYKSDDARLDEAILALKGRRMILLTGAWRKVTVEVDHSGETWNYMGSLASVISNAIKGDVKALNLLRAIERPELCRRIQVSVPP